MPVGKVVGQFEIGTILCVITPAKLWIETKDIAGISLDIFNKYFYGRNIAYGIKIKTCNTVSSTIRSIFKIS